MLREVNLRNSSSASNVKCMNSWFFYFMDHSNIAFEAVKDVEGIKMGQLPITVNHGAEKSFAEFWWKWNWIEVILVEKT